MHVETEIRRLLALRARLEALQQEVDRRRVTTTDVPLHVLRRRMDGEGSGGAHRQAERTRCLSKARLRRTLDEREIPPADVEPRIADACDLRESAAGLGIHLRRAMGTGACA